MLRELYHFGLPRVHVRDGRSIRSVATAMDDLQHFTAFKRRIWAVETHSFADRYRVDHYSDFMMRHYLLTLEWRAAENFCNKRYYYCACKPYLNAIILTVGRAHILSWYLGKDPIPLPRGSHAPQTKLIEVSEILECLNMSLSWWSCGHLFKVEVIHSCANQTGSQALDSSNDGERAP